MEDVEFENLRTLKDFLSEHTRIMINIATIIRNEQNVGKVHYIFYDLAAYSLKTFLKQAEGIDAKERHENDHGRRSESAPPERNGSHDWKESDLVKESYLLADALAFLHEGLYKETRYTLAHNDLKPENILVFYPNSKKIEERFPVGQWKIADFGLAKIKAQCEPTRIKRNSNRQNLTPEPQRGMGTVADIDLTHRRVRSASGASFRSDDMTKSKQDPGRYSAPEIEGIGEAQPDARKADIWAFGCVLAEVLAFGVNPSLVDELRKECELPEHLDQRFYDMTTNETKPTVRNWLKELDSKCESRRFRKEWIKKCANLICDNILVRDPRGRSSAKEIRTRLESIYEEMVKQMRHMPERDPRRLHLHGEPSPSSPFSDRSEPLESPTRVEDPPMLSILLPGQ